MWCPPSDKMSLKTSLLTRLVSLWKANKTVNLVELLRAGDVAEGGMSVDDLGGGVNIADDISGSIVVKSI